MKTPTQQHDEQAARILAKRNGKPAPKEETDLPNKQYEAQAEHILNKRETKAVGADVEELVLPEDAVGDDAVPTLAGAVTGGDDEATFIPEEPTIPEPDVTQHSPNYADMTKKQLKKACDEAVPPIPYEKKITNNALIALLTIPAA